MSRLVRLLIVWTMLVPVTAVAAADGVKTLDRTADPVIASAAYVPLLVGKRLDHIRVFAFRNGQALPIPFQIDQRDSRGDWVWDVVYRKRFMFIDEDTDGRHKREPRTRGRGTVDDQDPVGTPLFDANDELVFMAADAGDYNAAPQTSIGADLILAVELSDLSSGTRGWVYIGHYAASPPAPAATGYMRYDAVGRQVNTPIYSFHFSDEHMALIHDLQVKGVTIVDRIRIDGEITLNLPIPGRKVTFTEQDIHGYTRGYIAGPVRIIKRNIAHLALLGGVISASEVTCDNFYYARHAEIPVCLSIGFPVQQIEMTLTTDYRNPPFDRLYMGDAPKTSDVSRSLQSRLRRLGTEWIVLGGDEASLISLVVVPETAEGQAQALPCLCSGGQKPVHTQVTQGTATETGFLISSSAECPQGEHVLYGTYVIAAGPYEPGDEDAALKLKHEKLVVRVSVIPPAD